MIFMYVNMIVLKEIDMTLTKTEIILLLLLVTAFVAGVTMVLNQPLDIV